MNKGVKILITIVAVILMWAMVIGVVWVLHERSIACDGPAPRGEKLEEQYISYFGKNNTSNLQKANSCAIINLRK